MALPVSFSFIWNRWRLSSQLAARSTVRGWPSIGRQATRRRRPGAYHIHHVPSSTNAASGELEWSGWMWSHRIASNEHCSGSSAKLMMSEQYWIKGIDGVAERFQSNQQRHIWLVVSTGYAVNPSPNDVRCGPLGRNWSVQSSRVERVMCYRLHIIVDFTLTSTPSHARTHAIFMQWTN